MPIGATSNSHYVFVFFLFAFLFCFFFNHNSTESQHQKTYLRKCDSSKDSVQPHSRSLVRIFIGCILDSKVWSFFMRTTTTTIRLRECACTFKNTLPGLIMYINMPKTAASTSHYVFEPQRQKTYLRTDAPSKDSDQTAHSRSLNRIFIGCILDSK